MTSDSAQRAQTQWRRAAGGPALAADGEARFSPAYLLQRPLPARLSPVVDD